MTMSDTMIVISVIAGFGASLTAIGLLFTALFPRWVARAEARIRGTPVRASLTGLGLGLPGMLAVAALAQAPNGAVKFLGLCGFLAMLFVSFAGTAAFARIIGSRLPSPVDAERPWRATLRGWVVLFLSSLLPVLGWFLFLPGALLLGFGAAAVPAPVLRHPEADPLPEAQAVGHEAHP
jgi:hypothetical protein